MNDPRRIFRVPLFPLRRIERLRNELTTVAAAAAAAIVVTPSTQGQAGRTGGQGGGGGAGEGQTVSRAKYIDEQLPTELHSITNLSQDLKMEGSFL